MIWIIEVAIPVLGGVPRVSCSHHLVGWTSRPDNAAAGEPELGTRLRIIAWLESTSCWGWGTLVIVPGGLNR